METSTLTRKGQTTIPRAVRERLGLKPGDQIAFMFVGDNEVRLVARNLTIDDLRGMLPRPARAATLEEMDEAIAEAAIESGCP
jgi:AbrB family looped-hinge helix DNA binding protein